MKRVCLTFDIDYTDYYTGNQIDEITLAFPKIKCLLKEFQQVKTTWFIRIDGQIKHLFGKPDYILKNHREEIEWLQQNGHEIGWHYHAYRKSRIGWKQETDEDVICKELQIFGELAQNHGMHSVRMGWGFHTNKTIKMLDNMDFSIDSSAIPRPCYKWDQSKKDWSITPNHPYYPSQDDYRVPGLPSLSILEIPISTVHLPLPTDTEPGVIRYINPAYYHSKFSDIVDKTCYSDIVAISHPYEILKGRNTSPLISFKMTESRKNILFLVERGYCFLTIKNFASEWEKEKQISNYGKNS